MRMPQCFDGVRSVELAKLLDLKDWELVAYANEQRHTQTEKGLRRGTRDDGRHEYRREDEIRSGGWFVRRSWFRMLPEPGSNCSSSQIIDEEVVIEKCEREELRKAIKGAEEAAVLEQQEEDKLRHHSSTASHFGLDNQSEVEKRLKDLYGCRIRHIAEQAWRRRMQEYIDELENGDKDLRTVGVRGVLLSMKTELERRLRHFCPEDFFWVHDGETRNDVELMNYTRNYVAEEKKRRELLEVVGDDIMTISGPENIYQPSEKYRLELCSSKEPSTRLPEMEKVAEQAPTHVEDQGEMDASNATVEVEEVTREKITKLPEHQVQVHHPAPFRVATSLERDPTPPKSHMLLLDESTSCPEPSVPSKAKKRALRKRRDPVITDDVVLKDRLRSRSAMPVRYYKEESEEEEVIDKKQSKRRKAAAIRKVVRRKRAAGGDDAPMPIKRARKRNRK